jgi:hypothetical protein
MTICESCRPRRSQHAIVKKLAFAQNSERATWGLDQMLLRRIGVTDSDRRGTCVRATQSLRHRLLVTIGFLRRKRAPSDFPRILRVVSMPSPGLEPLMLFDFSSSTEADLEDRTPDFHDYAPAPSRAHRHQHEG